MTKTIIHLSDIHFRLNWEEDQGIVLDAFFKDLRKQTEKLDKSNIYIVFSGDIVLAGGDSELYSRFLQQFDFELGKLKIPFSQRICIPGNHDVSRDLISKKFIEHEGVVSQALNERLFNDYVSVQPNILTQKFDNYLAFQSNFAKFGLSDSNISGSGLDIDGNVGIYCLNTAICSSGGINEINDKGRLAIDTRSLQKWILTSKAEIKILVMHHPLEWLAPWAQESLKIILRNNFSMCLSGHNHEQALFYSINKELQLVECSAPPLFTDKKGNLGYSLISISEKGILYIQYRQWTKKNSFVIGVNFSETDDGKVIINNEETNKVNDIRDFISNIFNKKLQESLISYNGQPIIWLDPLVSKTNNISRNPHENSKNTINLREFVSHPKSTIIKAPPQFGLTCLANYLVMESWKLNSSFWLFLDAKNINSHTLEKSIRKELEYCNTKIENVKCIILDSWTNHEKDSLKLLQNLCNLYKDTPIIVMQTIDDATFMSETPDIPIEREFEYLHLLALPIGQIRKIVTEYNYSKHIGEDDAIFTKVVSDLEVLNIHRTPLNCLTLLKVFEKYFEESPVNRTKMLEMVLFLLFNMDNVPTYKAKPDLKDCEYVIGFYCEKMIRSNIYYFSREEFLYELKSFCLEKLIDLEVDVLFDILHANNIIINRQNQFSFRFSYWVYYFAALRMHQNADFAAYIYSDKRYVSFPSIIEFYTGIDRRREDALKIMIADLRETCDTVNSKVGIPDGMNPYRLAKWNPTEESIEKMRNEISENVLNSKLPDTVKDQYADRTYDQVRPYNQTINTIFKEYSCSILWHNIRAASRALRNSDYVNSDTKKELLTEIMRSWEQLTKVVLAVTPILATDGKASFEGKGFYLNGDFGNTVEQRADSIISNIPFNIVLWFKNDLFSNKIGPLLFDQISREENELKKHQLILLLICERPRGWKEKIQDYITSVSKNSFYLSNVVEALRNQYEYSYASVKTLQEIVFLLKAGFAKHEFGEKTGLDKIKKISNSVLPKRDIDDRL